MSEPQEVMHERLVKARSWCVRQIRKRRPDHCGRISPGIQYNPKLCGWNLTKENYD